MKQFVCVLSVLFCVLPANAQALLPIDYDPDIPTLETIIGHANGEEITTPEETLTYLEALRDAAPERMSIVPYAESWEGRELVYAVIASEKNQKRIDDILKDLARLGSGKP